MRELTGRDELLFITGEGPASRLVALLEELGAVGEETVRGWSMAAWEAELLDLRTRMSGPAVEAELHCPDCGEGVAVAFDLQDLPCQQPAPVSAPLPLSPFTVADLLALEDTGATGEEALAVLLASAARISKPAADEWLRGADRSAVLDALEVLASGLGLEMATRCAACDAPFTSVFDVALFMDAEMGLRAARLLGEVHLIASTYHWSESEILGLPHRRRQDYLGRILVERPLLVGSDAGA